MTQLFGPFDQAVTMNGLPLKGPLSSDQLEIRENVWIAASGGTITALGSKGSLLRMFPDAVQTELEGPLTLLPGFIDSHTHICWAGNRANDLALRLEGRTYLEIAEAGGGIWSSVRKCREAGQEALTAGIVSRADHLLSRGVTTIEVKSGYGLEKEAELKVLRAVRDAGQGTHAELIPTCLAAHMKPRDFNGSELQYLEHIATELLPAVMEEGLAKRVDVFIESTAFNTSDALAYLQEAGSLGFSIAVHGDQFSTGGSEVAVQCGAVSVDHLEASTDKEIGILAGSDVIATVLPGASIGLGMHYAPARKLLDAGCCLAIASDWNPGSAPMGELLIQACILGVYERLSMAETLAGLTYRASAALELRDRGILAQGMRADMQAYPVSDYREIIYRQGSLHPSYVWSGGDLVRRPE